MLLKITDNKKAEIFCHFIMNIQRFTESIIVNFLDDKFYIQGMEQSQVCLFEATLFKDYFDVYEKKEEDSCVIGLKTSIIQKLFNTRDVDQTVILSYEGDPGKINVSFETPNGSKSIPKYFEIPLIDIEQTTLTIPEKEYTADICLEIKSFSNIVSNLNLFGEDIKICCKEDEVWMSSNNFEGEMKVYLMDSTDNEYILEYVADEGCDMTIDFKSKYISNFCAFSKLSKDVHLYFIEGEPMQMKYKIDDKSFVRFYLAPTECE